MKLRLAVVLIAASLLSIFLSCRRNQPSLVDANRSPDTELWYAPADSTEFEYLIHLFWRGVDFDGIPVQYIWTITDSIEDPPLQWDPSQRVRDFRSGHLTTRTDTIIPFTAFRDVNGIGLRKNRQAFHVAAIDDNGVIDPSPARVEFIATVEDLPQMIFTTSVTRIANGTTSFSTRLHDPADIDTVGMFRPFTITYHGETVNGEIRRYKYFPITGNFNIPGSNIWSDDLSDTIRVFPNIGPDALPSGRFRFAAQVEDDAKAQSRVDNNSFTEGAVEIVINFEPDTRITQVENFYTVGFNVFPRTFDVSEFRDGTPDTMPARSWLTLHYDGGDNPGDSTLCTDPLNRCIDYQIQFTSIFERDGGPDDIEGKGSTFESTTAWTPSDPQDSNDFGTADSTTINVGSAFYQLRARAVDEFGKPDGTPDQIEFYANHSPDLDGTTLTNYDGMQIAPGDTIRWDWFNPANVADTLDLSQLPMIRIRKEFFFVIGGVGHDHPTEATTGGVKAWKYAFTQSDDPSVTQNFARAGDFFVDGETTNSLSDTFKLVFNYDFDPSGAPGDTAFANRPSYLDHGYKMTMRARDTANFEDFEQSIWILDETVDPPVPTLITSSRAIGVLGRFTDILEHDFYFTLER